MKKYEFTGDEKRIGNTRLYRIRAVMDFGPVKAGDLGGWIEKESNLSHKGLCWISGEASVYRDAEVYENALVYGDAQVFGDARVFGNARVHEEASVWGGAWIEGSARIYGHAAVHDMAWIHEEARVYGGAQVLGVAELGGNADVFQTAHCMAVMPLGKSKWRVTFFRDRQGELSYINPHSTGKADMLYEKALKDGSKSAEAYKLAIELARLQVELGGDEDD